MIKISKLIRDHTKELTKTSMQEKIFTTGNNLDVPKI